MGHPIALQGAIQFHGADGCCREETKQDDQRHNELRNRLDEITEKLDWHDKPAHKFVTELKEMTFYDEPNQLSRKNQELVRILWDTDWTSWAPGQPNWPFSVPRSVDKNVDDVVPVTVKILSSLPFSGMESRHESIPEAYAKTYEWIFSDQNVDKHGQELQWPSFPAWLQGTSESIYWITGKPGSGKSTLMKFIFDHVKLRDHLKCYAEELPLMLAGFFFWGPGSKMQKSHEGLVRTLLHQCLKTRQDLIPAIMPRRWALYNLLGVDSVAPEWTWQELKESFEILSSFHGKEFRLALFVDGLDEFDGDHKILIKWVKHNIARRGIKLCVSSRRWNVFSDAFGQDCSLTMQDLTRRDIEHFVQTEFDNSNAFQDLKAIFQDELDQLLREVIEKAEGVFLWVNLVVRSLIETLTDNPSLPHLQANLAEIPTDIKGLYNSIWKSIPPKSIPMSSKLFQLCIVQDPDVNNITVETFWLAIEGIPARSRANAMDDNARQGVSKVMKRLLDGHTRGILEISLGQVRFLHRSAVDWITDDRIWREICSKAPEDFDAHINLLEAYLARAPTELGSSSLMPVDIFSFIGTCFTYARGASKSTKVSEGRLVQALDTTNEVACDLSMAPSIKKVRFVFVDSKHAEHDGYSLGHWSTTQYHDINKENSFAGIVAQAGILKYVKAKVLANKNLLEPAPGRISLLENAVFPGLITVGCHKTYVPYNYFFPPEPGGEEQLRIVRFLLDVSDTRYETAFGDSLYDMARKAQRSELECVAPHGGMDGWMPPPQWYTEVLKLLEEHGYGTVAFGGPKESGAGRLGPDKAKKPRLSLSLRRIITKFRSSADPMFPARRAKEHC